MKIGIVITHPTQFDVPIFKLGRDIIEVIYTEESLVKNVFDPELGKVLTWGSNNLDGYDFQIAPENAGFWWLFSKFRKSKYDLLITNGYYNRRFIFSIIAGKMLAGKNALRLDTVQFNNVSGVRFFYKKILYLIMRQFIDVFFVVGSLSKKFLLDLGVNERRISYYGYIADNDFFSVNSRRTDNEKLELKDSLGLVKNKKIILCVSKHSQREAPFDTIEAFHKMNDDGLHLVLVGDGPLHDEVKAKAQKFGIRNITFAGYIHFTKLPLYYSIADLFVHDSHNEPWGVSVQEAIACNLPVVASDRVGASYDMIINGKNGFSYKAGEINQLAERIKQALILDPIVLRKTNALILEKWNYSKTLENIIERV